ncbi:MAG: response regulator [Chitinophagaceae bacterium]
MRSPELKIFVADDDIRFLFAMEKHLQHTGQSTVRLFSTSSTCLLQLPQKPDVIFLDYRMDNLDGISILQKIKRFVPNTLVVMVYDHDSIDIAVNSLKNGSFEYICKDNLTNEVIRNLVAKVHRFKKLAKNQQNIFTKFLYNTGLRQTS